MAKRTKAQAKPELILEPEPAQLSDEQVIQFVNESHRAVRDSLGDNLFKRKQIGDALAEMRERVQHGHWLAWVEENCEFAKRQAQNYLKISECWEALQEKLAKAHPTALLKLEDSGMDAALRLLRKPKKKKKPKRPESEESEERYAPLDLVQAARFTMGEIVLDPASTEQANKTVEAQRIFTREDDGLKQEWVGSAWVNPPVVLQGEFTEKTCASMVAGTIKQFLLCTDAITWEPWFHRALVSSTGLALVREHIDWLHDDGSPFPQEVGQVVFYAGRYNDRFSEAFDKYGFVITWGG